MDRTRIFHNHNCKIKLASSLTIQLVFLTSVNKDGHYSGCCTYWRNTCMKKLASTWIFWYLSRNSSWCLVVCWLFPSKFGTFLHDYICTCRVANRLDLDQTRRFVRPDLGPNCLHSLSADGISRKRDPENLIILFVYQVQMTEFHGSYKSIGTEIYRDVTVIRSLWNGRYFFCGYMVHRCTRCV